MAKTSLFNKIYNTGPLLLLYYLCISEVDTNLEKVFEIFTLNFQIILIYFWVLKRPEIMANGHVFIAGLVNDVVMGLPLGISSISYLTVSFVASYIRQVTVNISLFTDWFTFLLAIFFSNLVIVIFIYNFSAIKLQYTDIFYNAFFTFLFYPAVWGIFNFYSKMMVLKHDD